MYLVSVMLSGNSQLYELLSSKLGAELNALRIAAAAAHDAATHTENKPENKYDPPRGLEASYLAGAQEARASQLQAALDLVTAMIPRCFQSHDVVGLTALVKLSTEHTTCWYFLIQVAGGYTLQSSDEQVHGSIITLTPQTPLGRALVGKRIGDEIMVRTDKVAKE
ncbi:MAG: GreA/GreB family elongation factor [Deltaproteobacteria bacterium]|nr:GreA/GreB family elongation factor [Deltaproteobacteria bacterium]